MTAFAGAPDDGLGVGALREGAREVEAPRLALADEVDAEGEMLFVVALSETTACLTLRSRDGPALALAIASSC